MEYKNCRNCKYLIEKEYKKKLSWEEFQKYRGLDPENPRYLEEGESYERDYYNLCDVYESNPYIINTVLKCKFNYKTNLNNQNSGCYTWQKYGTEIIKGWIKCKNENVYITKKRDDKIEEETENLFLFNTSITLAEELTKEQSIFYFTISDKEIDELNKKDYMRLQGVQEFKREYDRYIKKFCYKYFIDEIDLINIIAKYENKYLYLMTEKIEKEDLEKWRQCVIYKKEELQREKQREAELESHPDYYESERRELIYDDED